MRDKRRQYPSLSVNTSSGLLLDKMPRNQGPLPVLFHLFFFQRSSSSEELGSSLQMNALLYISKGIAENVSLPHSNR